MKMIVVSGSAPGVSLGAVRDRATKATIRCIPDDSQPEEGRCVFSQQPSSRRVLFALNY